MSCDAAGRPEKPMTATSAARNIVGRFIAPLCRLEDEVGFIERPQLFILEGYRGGAEAGHHIRAVLH